MARILTNTVTDRLHDAGIRVFRDDGQKIGTDLLRTIRKGKISIPVPYRKTRVGRIGAFKRSFRRRRAWSASGTWSCAAIQLLVSLKPRFENRI